MLYRIPLLAAAVLTVGLAASQPAHTMAVNTCVRIVHNPQVNRETLVNTCRECVVAKIERRRPGSGGAAPSTRDYTLPGGSRQPLPFLGPGKSRIMSEIPCPGAR